MKSQNEYTNMCLSSDIAYGQVNKEWGTLFVLLHDCGICIYETKYAFFVWGLSGIRCTRE